MVVFFSGMMKKLAADFGEQGIDYVVKVKIVQ